MTNENIENDKKVIKSLTTDKGIVNEGEITIHSLVHNNVGNTSSSTIISVIKSLFNKHDSIIIKTVLETIEISKEDYESEKILLEPVSNSNALFFRSEEKSIVLFLNEVSISGFNK